MPDALELNPRRRVIAAATAAAAAAVVAAMGVVVLAGWAFDLEVLKSLLHPGRIAMNPATAVAFVLAGASLWLSRREAPAGAGHGRRITPAAACAGIVVLLAALKLVTFVVVTSVGGTSVGGTSVGGWNLGVGVDTVLFRSKLGGNVMAPNTAVNFLLVGLALFRLDAGRAAGRLPTALALGAAGVALLALTGYLYNVPTLYKPTRFIAMALNTALAFLALCLGILAARPAREPVATVLGDTAGGVIARRLLPPAVLIPMLLGWLQLRSGGPAAREMALAVMLAVLTTISAFVALVWWSARSLQRVDRERRQAEAALADKHRLLRTLIDNLPDYVFVKDEGGRFLLNNAAHARVLGGASADALVGKADADFFPREQAARYAADDREVLRTGLPLIDREELVPDGAGRVRWVTTTKVPFRDTAGQVVGLVGICHDVTERKNAQATLQRQNELLEQAAESEHAALAAEQDALSAERDALAALKSAQSQLVQTEKLASLGQMVAGVAHEINNPLSFVSNNVAVLQRDLRGLVQLLDLYKAAEPALAEHDPQRLAEVRELTERLDLGYTLSNLQELLTRSRDGLKRIQQIVKDLRDFARLDESDVHEIDLNPGFESTVNIIRGNAKKRQVRIEMDFGRLPMVNCFPAKVNQVVMNLLSNAIDASPENGVVTLRTRHLPEQGQVVIEVSDEGKGIAPEHLPRIFDPFFTTKPQGQGTGLGLSISYGIVQDHHGRIDVRSEVAKGSTFTVTLPVKGKPRTGGPPGAAPRGAV